MKKYMVWVVLALPITLMGMDNIFGTEYSTCGNTAKQSIPMGSNHGISSGSSNNSNTETNSWFLFSNCFSPFKSALESAFGSVLYTVDLEEKTNRSNRSSTVPTSLVPVPASQSTQPDSSPAITKSSSTSSSSDSFGNPSPEPVDQRKELPTTVAAATPNSRLNSSPTANTNIDAENNKEQLAATEQEVEEKTKLATQKNDLRTSAHVDKQKEPSPKPSQEQIKRFEASHAAGENQWFTLKSKKQRRLAEKNIQRADELKALAKETALTLKNDGGSKSIPNFEHQNQFEALSAEADDQRQRQLGLIDAAKRKFESKQESNANAGDLAVAHHDLLEKLQEGVHTGASSLFDVRKAKTTQDYLNAQLKKSQPPLLSESLAKDEDNREREKAATTIQKVWRGYIVREYPPFLKMSDDDRRKNAEQIADLFNPSAKKAVEPAVESEEKSVVVNDTKGKSVGVMSSDESFKPNNTLIMSSTVEALTDAPKPSTVVSQPSPIRVSTEAKSVEVNDTSTPQEQSVSKGVEVEIKKEEMEDQGGHIEQAYGISTNRDGTSNPKKEPKICSVILKTNSALTLDPSGNPPSNNVPSDEKRVEVITSQGTLVDDDYGNEKTTPQIQPAQKKDEPNPIITYLSENKKVLFGMVTAGIGGALILRQLYMNALQADLESQRLEMLLNDQAMDITKITPYLFKDVNIDLPVYSPSTWKDVAEWAWAELKKKNQLVVATVTLMAGGVVGGTAYLGYKAWSKNDQPRPAKI